MGESSKLIDINVHTDLERRSIHIVIRGNHVVIAEHIIPLHGTQKVFITHNADGEKYDRLSIDIDPI